VNEIDLFKLLRETTMGELLVISFEYGRDMILLCCRITTPPHEAV